jgi:SAM-dependent MidA family methyltransferase
VPTPLHSLIVDTIRRDGPMTVAAFMELALYHPEHGYYTSLAQRSGRGGDFYTSVDAGPFFGEMLAVQIAEMAGALRDGGARTIDLVEAGAGNGRLMRDVLDALQREFPDEYACLRVQLVERSGHARAAHPEVLGGHTARLAGSSAHLPDRMEGILYANELLDAFPVHLVVRRTDGLREIFVDASGGRLVEREGPLSSNRLQAWIDAFEAEVPFGVRIEIAFGVDEWIRAAASRLARGFLIVIDYGDDAAALWTEARAGGTLRAFRRHRVSERWLDDPGEQDLTAHVNFTAVDRAADAAGLRRLGRTAQAAFLLSLGAIERLEARAAARSETEALRLRLTAKTLLVPGTTGWSHSITVYEKGAVPAFRPRGLEKGVRPLFQGPV